MTTRLAGRQRGPDPGSTSSNSLEDQLEQNSPPGGADAGISAQRVGELVDAVASDAPTPGGGAVAGIAAALGAALVGMAGRYAAKHDPESALFGSLVQSSDRLRARAAALADDDAAAYGRYLLAVRLEGDPDARRTAIRLALDAAADVPSSSPTSRPRWPPPVSSWRPTGRPGCAPTPARLPCWAPRWPRAQQFS